MQIVIPMSGFGERFRRKGFNVPKPLIEVDGKPIISHVVDLFPGETDVTFICNEDHLAEPDYLMRRTLEDLAPFGKIIGIKPHKLGPVHAINEIRADLDSNQPVVANYCDFSCYWDWGHFKQFTSNLELDGAIPAYRGFHPHSLGPTNYAYLKESEGMVSDIQEKTPFTENKMMEFASSGTYFFKSAALMFEAFDWLRENEISISGEYYVSLAYKYLFESDLKVGVYPLQHFAQWGTPEDLHEYRYWSNLFSSIGSREQVRGPSKGSVVIPLAGEGKRFKDRGYTKPKPLIEVSGAPMVIQAAKMLPPANNRVFVLRRDMDNVNDCASQIESELPDSTLTYLDELTDGQARSAKYGVDELAHLGHQDVGPLIVGATDNGAIYSQAEHDSLLQKNDILVWGISGYPYAINQPQMYGWIRHSDGHVRGISVKVPLDNPETDPIVIGTVTFKSPEVFERCFASMVDRGAMVGGEYYLDTMINDAVQLGFNVSLFEVDSLANWGTPIELATFEYWQSFFSKWAGHPYSIEKDLMVDSKSKAALIERYRPIVPSATNRGSV